MSPAMHPCTACGCHMASLSSACPHCGAAHRADAPRATPSLAAALLGLALVGCADGGDDNATALYGAPYVDDDNDGWQPPEDCDDNDATIHPDAEETVGDGVDSNCDGDDDT